MRLNWLFAAVWNLILFSQLLAEPYEWPLDGPPALTSTYAEYRSGRFHAGLDVKTWGKEGYACVAVSDGYVWRVRTSPWGYGKVVYLKLINGRTAVYAHLSSFAESIEQAVADEQDHRGAYSVDLYLPPGQIPVKRGETVAFSGSTGSGFPHLHFEIRDEKQRPLNPLLNGFRVTDTTQPTLVALAFIPLDAEARVDGRNVPTVRTLTWSGDRWSADPVSLWGRIGLALKVFDRADASALTNRLAPYGLTLMVDEQKIFRSQYDAFSYTQVYEVDLDRSFILNRSGMRGFHNLYVERGNTLPLYGDFPIGSGVLYAGVEARGAGSHLGPGAHSLKITADDAAGNEAIAEVDVAVTRPVWIAGMTATALDKGVIIEARFDRFLEQKRSMIIESSGDLETWKWIKTARVKDEGFATTLASSTGPHYRARFEDGPAAICSVDGSVESGQAWVTSKLLERRSILTIASTEPFASPPSVRVGSKMISVHAVSGSEYEAVIPNETRGSEVRVNAAGLDTTLVLSVRAVRPTGGTLESTDGLATARFGSSSVYHPFEGRVETVKIKDERVQLVGKPYKFEPAVIPFRDLVPVHIESPEGVNQSHLGLYELTDKGWSFVWNDVDSVRKTIGAGVRHFSVYALIVDDVAPEVDIDHPKDGSTTPLMPEIRVSMRDSLSGLTKEELIAFDLDGETMIFEYDPEADVARGLLRKPLAPGSHTLTVRVRDTCGNETVAVSRFTAE